MYNLKGTLVFKPQGKGGRATQPIVYNVKEGRLKDLEIEFSKDEWSAGNSSSPIKATSSDNSSESENSIEVMGVVLADPILDDGSNK